MSQIEIQDFSAFGSGIVDWSENGVQQPTDGSVHFERTYDSPIKITGVEYDESMWVEPYEGSEGKRTITFNSDEIEVDKKLYIGGLVYLNGQNIIFNSATSDFYSDGSLYLSGNSTLNISFKFSNNGVLSLSNGSNDFNGTIWETNTQNVEFGENSSIKITTASNGKTLIKATTLTGTITLDVDEGVEDGTTFSIEATNNNLIIENAEGYEVTSESVGNVTTYTVSIVSATKEVKELEVGGVVYPIKDEVARSTKQDIIDDLEEIRSGAELGATALQSISSSDVTSALGYTPYDASNPNGYTSNVGTVTSVNNVQPVNGNVSLTIPTVNNATLTIQKNGTSVGTFTANASSNVTANITVPTDLGDLTNNAGYTKNVGTVTSVNNVSPVSGNVSLTIPTITIRRWS